MTRGGLCHQDEDGEEEQALGLDACSCTSPRSRSLQSLAWGPEGAWEQQARVVVTLAALYKSTVIRFSWSGRWMLGERAHAPLASHRLQR